jgi:hypothetical protein
VVPEQVLFIQVPASVSLYTSETSIYLSQILPSISVVPEEILFYIGACIYGFPLSIDLPQDPYNENDEYIYI